MESGETSWALWSECPRALAQVGLRNDPSSMDTRGGERSALPCEPRRTLGANRESHWAHLQCGGFEAFAPRSRYPEEEREGEALARSDPLQETSCQVRLDARARARDCASLGRTGRGCHYAISRRITILRTAEMAELCQEPLATCACKLPRLPTPIRAPYQETAVLHRSLSPGTLAECGLLRRKTHGGSGPPGRSVPALLWEVRQMAFRAPCLGQGKRSRKQASHRVVPRMSRHGYEISQRGLGSRTRSPRLI